jgi:hypothetical protein
VIYAAETRKSSREERKSRRPSGREKEAKSTTEAEVGGPGEVKGEAATMEDAGKFTTVGIVEDAENTAAVVADSAGNTAATVKDVGNRAAEVEDAGNRAAEVEDAGNTVAAAEDAGNTAAAVENGNTAAGVEADDTTAATVEDTAAMIPANGQDDLVRLLGDTKLEVAADAEKVSPESGQQLGAVNGEADAVQGLPQALGSKSEGAEGHSEPVDRSESSGGSAEVEKKAAAAVEMEQMMVTVPPSEFVLGLADLTGAHKLLRYIHT